MTRVGSGDVPRRPERFVYSFGNGSQTRVEWSLEPPRETAGSGGPETGDRGANPRPRDGGEETSQKGIKGGLKNEESRGGPPGPGRVEKT